MSSAGAGGGAGRDHEWHEACRRHVAREPSVSSADPAAAHAAISTTRTSLLHSAAVHTAATHTVPHRILPLSIID